MEIRVMWILILFLTLTPPALGQRRGQLRSPEVDSDGRVSFRLQAANSDGVELLGQWPEGRRSMTKSDNDVWQLMVGPVSSPPAPATAKAPPLEVENSTELQ